MVAEIVGNAVLSCVVGALPERQPWRAIVATLYLVLAVACAAGTLWILARTL